MFGTLLALAAGLISPALFATFDWRYQLPQLTLIPVAAAIGGAALLPYRTFSRTRCGNNCANHAPRYVPHDFSR